MMNTGKWEALPSDLQKVMEDNSGMARTVLTQDILYDKYVKGNLQWVEENCPAERFITLSDAELARWRQTVEPLWDSWIADAEANGIPGQELVNAAESAYEAYKQEYGE